MTAPLRVLCVHGVGHEEADPQFVPKWTRAITDGLGAWDPRAAAEVQLEFLGFDDLFDHAPLNAATFAAAFTRLLGSGLSAALGDLAHPGRGLLDLPATVRWSAGMVAQWATEAPLRRRATKRLLERVRAGDYQLILAHSLGSLLTYDALVHEPPTAEGRTIVTFGSQIGAPFVRAVFGGRIAPLARAARWYHLYNPEDHAFTAPLALSAPNFEQVMVPFDAPDDALNHDAAAYLAHPNVRESLWRAVAAPAPSRGILRRDALAQRALRRPTHRALLVGINEYPDPANRLAGCINDTYRMSEVLQERGIPASGIRLLHDARATTAGLVERLHWLLDGAHDGDERLFFYSGHGAQLPAYGVTDEVDHLDECLVPWDFDWSPAHAFIDDQFRDLYSQLPYGVQFTAILDCCHAGGMTREGGARVRGISPPDDIRHRAMRWSGPAAGWRDRRYPEPNATLARSADGASFAGTDGATYRLGRALSLRTLPNARYDAVRERLGHAGPYLPVLLEACQEGERAQEHRVGTMSFGAFTWCLTETMRARHAARRRASYASLIRESTVMLHQLRYDQTPALVGPATTIAAPRAW